ncbi:MAG: hypothetical protein H6730_13490 [Deltaproteobacteria bacterium]|nr:hypothetical protein [Deltaproteobacteria bacterium]
MAVQREPTGVRWVQDALRLLFSAALVAAVLAAVILPPPTAPAWLDVVGRVLAGVSGELACVLLLRAVVPRANPGWHRIVWGSDYLRWVLSCTLNEVALHPLFRAPFWYLHFTRVLYLKALGAQVAWTASFPADLVLRDPSMVRIGPGAQIEPAVTLEGALHGAGRVRVGGVEVGAGCLIGAHSVVMPGAALGLDARVEPACVIGEDVKIGVSCTIGEGARLQRSVEVGAYVHVGTGAILAEGVKVGDRARVGPGALVEPDAVIGERQTWTGIPARRVDLLKMADEVTEPRGDRLRRRKTDEG